MAFRFGVFDEISLEDLKKKQVSKSTKCATNFGVKVLKEFIKETNYNLPPDGNILSYSEEELVTLFTRFYAQCRMKDGKFYHVNSMKSIRFSLQRFFNDNFHTDIIQNRRFVEANIVFENVLKRL